MSFSSAESMRVNVVSWLADQFDEVLRRRAARATQHSGRRSKKPGLLRRGLRQAKEVVVSGAAEPPVQYQRVRRYMARSHAEKLQAEALRTVASIARIESPRDLAARLCELLGASSAASLTAAWFENRDLGEGDANVDMGNLEWVIGIAAAVVVATVVLLVRRGREVQAHRQRLSPTEDFKLLLEVAKEEGAAGDVARSIQSKATEPWRWNLVDGVAGMEERVRRDLLRRLAVWEGSKVESVDPDVGVRFDPRTMSTADDVNQDDLWVVTETLQQGFIVGGRTVDTARVAVATLDSRVLLDGACPVGRLLNERADELVPGGRAGVATWRATWGLTHPEDLRELLDEAVLDGWRKRMIDEINDAYPGSKTRQLVLTGKKGAIFEPSTMDVEGAPPVGDAIIEDLVARDGVPQHGLACPGGSPLLLAVVRISTVEAS